ncbi:MAG: hypothetical protein E6I87_02985 [Chloroflexi bacterium]|nr:MAG: hypothetical protein E6I87_02985 [Chloroflexota bacterium]
MDKSVEKLVDEIVEWTGITFDDASRSDGEGMVQGMSDVRETTLRDFVLFCFERRPVPWPTLYDEMCYVAGHRLFRDMGYEELRQAGLDFTLVGLSRIARLAQDVCSAKRVVAIAV